MCSFSASHERKYLKTQQQLDDKHTADISDGTMFPTESTTMVLVSLSLSGLREFTCLVYGSQACRWCRADSVSAYLSPTIYKSEGLVTFQIRWDESSNYLEHSSSTYFESSCAQLLCCSFSFVVDRENVCSIIAGHMATWSASRNGSRSIILFHEY